MNIAEPERRTPVLGKHDVVVAGGGPAGLGAAVAAARNGADTLLIERYGFLGGMYTAGYVMGMHLDKVFPMKEQAEERPLIGGIAQELVEKLVEMKGGFPPSVWAKYQPPTAYIPSDPEMMKLAFLDLVEGSGAKLLLHAFVVGALIEDNMVKGVIIESKSGRQAILADAVVDCTGDGDVAYHAGAQWEKTPKDRLLPMSLVTIYGGVDIERAKEALKNIDEIRKKAIEEGLPPERALPERPTGRPLLAIGFWGIWDLPAEERYKYWQRRGEATDRYGASYFGDCTDVQDLTRAEITLRKYLLRSLGFHRKHVPGFENAYIAATAPQVGIRESRRITGDYILTWDEDAKKCLRHNDVVCQARPPVGPAFDVPYRCLVPQKVEGILTAGRCISVDQALAHRIAIRDEIQATGLGQVSGTAAALSVKARVKPRDLDIPTLQGKLREQGLNVPERQEEPV